MKTLVFGNLFKLFRLASTFAREVYHLGVKMKTNMTIVLFFSLSPTANCPCECDGKFKSVNKLPNTGVFTALLSGRCGHLQKLQNKRVTSLIEWKTPSYQWRGGSKWVGEGRVVTVHMWNKCSGFALATFTLNSKCFCFFFLFNNRRKKGLKHTIMWTPKSLKTG